MEETPPHQEPSPCADWIHYVAHYRHTLPFPASGTAARHRGTETTPMSSPEPKSPLTIIAIFAGIIEASALASLPFLDESSQSIYTWFLVGFPPFLTLLFFLTLNFNTKSLYGPDEQGNEPPLAETSQSHTALPETSDNSHTSPPLALPCSHITEQSTVIISGPNSQSLLEVVACHALQATRAGRTVLHNLEQGTRICIVTEIPQNHSPPEEQKKTRH